jgi:transposase
MPQDTVTEEQDNLGSKGAEDSDLEVLKSLTVSGVNEFRLVERARIVLMHLEGVSNANIARYYHVRPNTVGKWIKRYSEEGVDGLFDLPRTGAPPKYEPARTRAELLAKLADPPPKGQSVWDGKSLGEALGISPAQVWRILKKEGISLQRQRSWCVSTDPQFAQKAADIVGLYLNPPENAIVISIDEKPSIQALQRATGYVKTSNGSIVRGIKSTYVRHGTVNLFAALSIATGIIQGEVTERKTRVDFLNFMDQVVENNGTDTELHVILDNYCIHKKCDAWLEKHPNVYFHFTPTSASWLNLVEVWFGIFSKKALRGASFEGISELTQANMKPVPL